MGQPIASMTRLQIRQAIGNALGNRSMIASTWSASGTSTTAKDAVELSIGGADEYIGSQIQFNEVTGQGYALKRWLTDSTVSGEVTFPTISGSFAGVPGSGEDYELWKPPYNIENINQRIANAETEMLGLVFSDKEDHTTFTQDDKYQYTFPSGFTHIDGVEFCYSIDTEEDLDDCDSAWTTGATNVSASVNTSIEKEGTGCAKIAVAAGAVSGDTLAYVPIDSTDLTDMTEVEMWIYSSVALSGGDLQLLLDNTAACASPEESLNIPVTSAYTWTRHIISLANPASDSAIISVGLKMMQDRGAFDVYLDDIIAVDANSRYWKSLHKSYWGVVHGSTNYLWLSQKGLSTAGANRALRLTGYQQFTSMSGDAVTSQLDPDFIINRVAQQLGDREELSYFAARAGLAKQRGITKFRSGTIRI